MPRNINPTEEIAKKRERIANVERHASYIPIHNHDSIFSKQEISEHFKVLKGLFAGEISKEDGMKYKECVETAIGARKHNRCKLCDNDGLVFKSDDRNYQYVFRCNCDCGKRRQESFSMWGSFRERMFF